MNLQLVIFSGMVVGLLYVVVVLQMFLSRLRHRLEVKHQIRLEERWLPILTAEGDVAHDEIPRLDPRDAVSFMVLWNLLHESFTGDIRTRINQVARRAGLDEIALKMLAGRSLRKRLLAVSTLGQLRDKRAWDRLVQLTAHRDAMLSLAAARAMVRIDAAAALPVILPRAAARVDWSRNYVLGILSELEADVVSRPLTQAAAQLPVDQAHRLVQYFSVAHVSDAVPVVRAIIGKTTNTECLAACLRVFVDIDALDVVREYLRHPSWSVRVQAVNVLGRLGSASDYAILVPLLSDPEWWVRYRAAKALCGLPGVEPSAVAALSTQSTDAFARDILTHVLAEAHA